MARRARLVLAALFFCLYAASAPAVPAWVPDVLKPWIPWVSDGAEYRQCPFLMGSGATDAGDYRCSWPGVLALETSERGATFTQAWEVAGSGQWVPLPGEIGHWPVDVTVDGRSADVYQHRSGPALWLDPGRYRISGRIRWEAVPSTLAIPEVTGLIALTVDGAEIRQPRRGDVGVYLGADGEAARTDDTLGLQVYRLVEDAVPNRLTTQLTLDVAGRIREVVLGPVLPEGFAPESLASPLPARIDLDGTLRVQIAPGSWTITLIGRAGTLVETIPRPTAGASWPEMEIWSYRADERLRIAVPRDMNTVDPGQVGVPGRWQNLPAFAVPRGEEFRLEQRRRGGSPDENQLSLSRDLWLDFDGRGLTAVDSLTGSMQRDWRLDMLTPYRLLGARDRQGNPLLITGTAETDSRGIEWRETAVDLRAISRLERRSRIPASGWAGRLMEVDTTLHLPPGHRLAAAFGADRAPGAWLARWSLLDLFVVLLSAAAAGRLYGRGVGLAVLVTLGAMHQDFAPFSWLLLNLLAAVALARAAPEGRLRAIVRGYRQASLAALVVLFIPFAVDQIKTTLYPQLELYAAYQPVTMPAGLPARSAMAVKEMAESQIVAQAPDRVAADAAIQGQPAAEPVTARYAPDVRVQTGPGFPAWQWQRYTLSWSGPVDEDRSVRLVILPRWAVAGWRLAMVGLGLLTIWWLGRDTLQTLRKARLPLSGGSAAVLVAALLIGSAVPGEATAELPSPAMLDELRERLLRAPDCVPDCGNIQSATVSLDADGLEVILQVNALAAVAVPVPGSDDQWLPETLTVNDADPVYVYRDAAGVLWLPLGPGSHGIVLNGRLPDADRVELAFPAVPKTVSVAAQGWSVAGLRGRRLVAGALEFSRIGEAEKTGASADLGGSRFPEFLRIERNVTLGLDWTVTTRAVRIAPESGSLSVSVPLLPGEAVISEGVTVNEREVAVALAAGENVFVWRSALERTPTLELTAPEGLPWSEQWRFAVGNTWHAEVDGVPVYRSGDPSWQPVFLPLPGETLRVDLRRPEAIDGTTLAIDRSTLDSRVGARSAQHSLRFTYRSSLGGPHLIELPPGAELASLSQDGSSLPLPAAGEAVRIPTLPGMHSVSVEWRERTEGGLRMATPAVDLGAPVSNIAISAQLPESRWILFTYGPVVGPAVLYWPQLAALVVVALLLGRIRLTPLRTRHWFLLGLGFSTFAWPAFGLVALWLLVMGWRERWSTDMPAQRFQSLQIIVGLLSLLALLSLVVSIPIGLLGAPDMHITGNGSFRTTLSWFQDRSAGALPVAGAFSVSLWIYKVAILLWALWLSFALVRWLPWAWRAFSHGGLWRGRIEAAGEA